MADNFKAIHTYSDPGLDKQKTYEYDLSIRMHADGLSYVVMDGNTNKFLHLEAFDISEPGRKLHIPGEPENTSSDKLAQLFDGELNWLCQPFKNTRILLEQGKSTLIPEALFLEEEKTLIFDFNVAEDRIDAANLKHDYLRAASAYNIFHLPPKMSQLIQKCFDNASVFHHSTACIQSILLKHRNIDSGKQLFVNAAASHVDILQISNKKLEYYNSFVYNTAEDFMYYLVFIVEQLELNPESVELIVSGEIEKHSPLSDLIHKYIRHVSYIERNADFRYSFIFDSLPGHYYYNLLNASLCE